MRINELNGIAGDCHEPFATEPQVLYRSVFIFSSADADACVRSIENELIEVHFVSAF